MPFSHARRALFFLLLVATVSRAELNTVGLFRMGEDDTDAKPGAVVNETVNQIDKNQTLTASGQPQYGDAVSGKATGSKLSIRLDGQEQSLRRNGLAVANDNFVAETFARAESEEGFHVVMQYGSAAHGWSLVQNGKGFQVLLGGVALVGWSGDTQKGEWVHLAVARVNGVTRFYFNGKPAGENSAAMHDTDDKTPFSVGANSNGKDGFVGEIDEVRISNFPVDGFNPNMLQCNDPDGKNASTKAPPQAKASERSDDTAWNASITFDEKPVEKNMVFNRAGLVSKVIAAPNGSQTGWVAQQGSAKDVPWARSVLITLTDSALREGRHPVVDIEVEYRQTFDSPVELRADTKAGSRIVGGGWGRNENWQKFTARVDDAYFGARNFDHPSDQMHTDGYDLRVNSFGTDFAIRSIKIKAYDLDEHPDYKRLIRFDRIACDNELLLFAPNSPAAFQYVFSNLATKPMGLSYRFEVIDRMEKVRYSTEGVYEIPTQENAPLGVKVDTTGYEQGAYETRLTLLSPEKEVIFERHGGFGIADETPVARAEAGEFLYGLDVKLGPAYDSPRLLRWAKFMGADIIRHGFGWSDNLDEVTDHLPAYEQAGLQVMLMCDPPKTQNPDERASQLQKKVDFLRAAAKRFPQIRFYELGNEPDLTYFYPGPMQNYVEDFHVMSDAIREANPQAVVLNGGLCFAGAEATMRAKEFIERVDPNRLGAWSYHGHGPGWGAEASAFERISALVRAAGKTKPFADTESGVAATTPAQQQVQARTVVQKMVYAQQQKLPFLMFFRLLMFEEAYGMLHSEQEPRPAVIAYANLVRQLRGLRYESPLSDLPTGVQGHLFKTVSGDGRACVIWSDGAASQRLQLKTVPAVPMRSVDLYGNQEPIKSSDDGEFTIDISADPVYLKWEKDSAPVLTVVPNAINTPSEITLRSVGQDVIPVTITSFGGQEIDGTLHVHAGELASVRVGKDSLKVNVPAGGNVTMAIPVEVLPRAGGVDWPNQWTAFVGVDEKRLDLKSLQDVPDRLPKTGGGETAGQQAFLQNDRIDFESLGGAMRERAAAVVMGLVHADADQTVRVGASADWWMEWMVKGQSVFSTMDRGNGMGYAITDHTFDLPLQKGDNLVAVRVHSGSMGWKLLIGAPDRLAEADADPVKTRVQLTLDQPGKPSQSRSLSIRRARPIENWPFDRVSTTLADWRIVQPDFLLLEHVDNAFAKQPDADKWWHGIKDLSARGWVRLQGQSLVICLAVSDEDHRPATDAVEDGDAVRLLMRTGESKVVEVDVIASKGGGAIFRVNDKSVQVTGSFSREDGVSFYQINIDAPAVRPDQMNIVLFDQDAIPAKQRMTLAPESAIPFDGWLRLIWAG